MSEKTLLACLALLCGGAVLPAQNQKLILAVVGANVPPTQGKPYPEPCGRNVPGNVLYFGARIALEAEPEDVRKLLQIESWDDGGCREAASDIARRLAQDPRVLAVIGHATSATTSAAAVQYAKAGIPLLAPMATSQIILFPYWPDDTSTRLTNVFRLPPGDESVQGPAVADLLEHDLKPPTGASKVPKYVLVQDYSPDARGYSDPLVRRIRQLVRDIQVIQLFPPSVGTNGTSFSAEAEVAADKVRRESPDIVIFCGYPSALQLFIAALDKRYPVDPSTTGS